VLAVAWSWSHTAEAYAAAYANCCELPLETLQVIAAEWEAVRPDESDADFEGFSHRVYESALARIKREELSADLLADLVWEQASEQATCDNGGWAAWLCPFGCGCHSVQFDRAA